MNIDPRPVAARLAGIYGQAVESPLMYPTGVALLGRLRLAGPDSEVVDDIARLAEPLVAAPDSVPDWAPCLAVACFADELLAVTGDARYRDFLDRSSPARRMWSGRSARGRTPVVGPWRCGLRSR